MERIGSMMDVSDIPKEGRLEWIDQRINDGSQMLLRAEKSADQESICHFDSGVVYG
jgi:hypothetical protein